MQYREIAQRCTAQVARNSNVRLRRDSPASSSKDSRSRVGGPLYRTIHLINL